MVCSPNNGAVSHAADSSHSSTTSFAYNQRKRLRPPEEVKAECSSVSAQKKAKTVPQPRNLVDWPSMTDEVNSGIYGSVTQDMEDLMTRKREVLKSIFRINAERSKSNVLSQQESAHARTYFIDLGEEDDDEKNQVKETMRDVIVIIDDDCEIEDQGPIKARTEIVETAEEDEKTQLLSSWSKMQPTISDLVVNVVDRDIEEKSTTELPKETADIVQEAKEILEKDSSDRDLAQGQSLRNNSLMFGQENKVGKDIEDDVETKEGTDLSLEKDGSPLAEENETGRSKGFYVGVEDDIETDEGDNQPDSSDDDGLANIWKEMAIAQECSKDTTADPPSDERFIEGEDYCDHHFVLRDDIGDVCRICGIVKRGIEEIIEYQMPKGARSTRTYARESGPRKDKEPRENSINFSRQDFMPTEITAHPRHKKQMKDHQVEGFNFLIGNLVSDNPSGCILAHAPGSGKTFMIISFIQCFMAKYPDARPLVVLPKGILGTWKQEFLKWQIEDIPLLDLYSNRPDHRADSRSQQLEVLKQWVHRRSILFLGYQQFSSIICDNASCQTTAACQEILLTRPSILIMDEGHTPRNDNTDLLNSLKKVQTLRKVVLSGTLYQNNVKEVFNIFDLVRPRFLRSETSRSIMRRILSRVSSLKLNADAKSQDITFFKSVEYVLQKDEDFKRKVTVIKDLREMTRKVLHFYKGDFLDELPGLVDFTVFLNLSPRQQNGLQELTKSKSRFKISSEGSLLYVHPELRSMKNNLEKNLHDETEQMLENLDFKEGVKAKFFLNMLSFCESGNEKLLVFSQFVQPLRFLERLVVKMKGWSLGKEIFMITGDSTSEGRELAMDQFNKSSDARVFFGSIKACGEGISLVGASRIIILDVHLNPSVSRQALGRAFRPGQTKKVYTYRLVAAESPEEDDHTVCFRKESISKMWFEWNEFSGSHEFEMEKVNVQECGDPFLESARLNEDVKALYRR